MSEQKQEVKHDKCGKCKCWRLPADFLNEKGRLMKTCRFCRRLARQARGKEKTPEEVLDKYFPSDISKIILKLTGMNNRKFVAGRTYYKNNFRQFKVVKRTPQNVWVIPAGDLKDIKLKIFRTDDDVDPEYVKYDFDAVYADDIEIVGELTEEQKRIERFDVAMEEARRRKQERAEIANRLREEIEERKRMIQELEQ